MTAAPATLRDLQMQFMSPLRVVRVRVDTPPSYFTREDGGLRIYAIKLDLNSQGSRIRLRYFLSP